MLETDVIIIGSGPAGSTAALALSNAGIANLVITKYRWLADTPRAHYINTRTLEVLRDLGVHQDVIAKAAPLEVMGNVVFCNSLTGKELGRLPYGANDPKRRSDYLLASPCEQCDLPQHLLEPILLGRAVSQGSHVRFDSQYLSHQQDPDGVVVQVSDRLSGSEYSIRCKYLLGADGANSKVAADLQLPMEGKMGKSGSISIILRADLSQYVAHRPGYLWWMLQPGADIGGIGMGLLRMVRPWNEWQIVWGYDINGPAPELTNEQAIAIVHQFVGDTSVEVEISSISLWTVNEMYAARYSQGRVFCLGDAVHRHPPTNGLGSNTSIQDAYNLAWKLSLVLAGTASPSLLETYDTERIPVGRQIIRRANKSVEDFAALFQALDLTTGLSAEQMNQNIRSLEHDTPEGAQRRKALRKAIQLKAYEFATQGVELNIRYQSDAIVEDADEPFVFSQDSELFYQPSLRAGGRLPHAWVNKNGRQLSTLDLVGKGQFTVITGIAGGAWVEQARQINEVFGLAVRCVTVGPGRDVEDLYGDWSALLDDREDACLLVRPDAHIAWHGNLSLYSPEHLRSVLSRVLGL
ncbi:FAD-dependent monooxygenase [Pseudomonas sp. FP597]|nr:MULTISPECIES: FAD-dependent monooxygenase [Pseudomonas]WLI08831.1 FAD-dependent monooxygenase [Pseudomonas sp. FP597]